MDEAGWVIYGGPYRPALTTCPVPGTGNENATCFSGGIFVPNIPTTGLSFKLSRAVFWRREIPPNEVRRDPVPGTGSICSSVASSRRIFLQQQVPNSSGLCNNFVTIPPNRVEAPDRITQKPRIRFGINQHSFQILMPE